jgi:D-xylose transport system permease protein
MTGTRAEESAVRDAAGRAAIEEGLDRPDARHPLRALAQGDLGSVRVLIALALIWAIFTSQDSTFFTAQNLTNLTLQIAAVGTVSIGVVLILLLGEIDLSVGAVAGLCASIAAVLSVKNGWDPKVAILAAIAAGAAIGMFHGAVVTFFGIPSFVVTLAGLIAWQGAQLKVLGATGTVNLPTPGTLTDLSLTYYSHTVGWIIALVAIGVFVASGLYGRRQRIAAGLEPSDIRMFGLRLVLVSGAILLTVGLVFNQGRGVPLSPLVFVVLVALFAFVTERTRFGRHIFAVGGNEEAARRAGIKTKRIKVAVFMLASTLAAVGGVLLAARQLSVGQNTPDNSFLLLAIAGPVVAGTSLFGGRGTVWAALLGALVMGSISNGMDLLALESPTKFMITGGVLLAAVILDALTSGRRQSVTR